MSYRRDDRSDEARAYRKLYNCKAWRTRRAALLRAEPLCRYCARLGRVTAATVADHIIPHRGDPELFAGDLQPLCSPCHSRVKQREENGGWDGACNLDGYPIDPSHPNASE
ncbi:5-methylcytosine-specific restriction endonuclease McrA [Novosphingobium chloroacetimidivorans]|uniref:5-methylcytosine-specific restriction endonuclease McrA n=1 Tax=Novosphingobium chloroacetimidivorans TaxID=1428314 RepID=A0A7W7KAX2_9SPHN|nr:HNH endonuclease signature motif containing protein [Novosphingobium chloroacetimidivorans]MBB4859452.1 5-methylcytosine-specific restriction endonuclease McrA [Novosphingobium chloroacetimidivorans]